MNEMRERRLIMDNRPCHRMKNSFLISEMREYPMNGINRINGINRGVLILQDPKTLATCINPSPPMCVLHSLCTTEALIWNK